MKRLAAAVRPDLGHQRLWRWRGWQVRYTYLRPRDPVAQQQTPMVLVHGFGASLEQWRSNLTVWSHQRPVYALDLLGFGHSQKPATLLGAEFWQQQVYDFCQALIGQPVILLGHSLGALVALTTAARHPSLVRRLILLTLPLARQELISGWLERLSRAVEGVFATPLLLRPLFALVRRPPFIRNALLRIYRYPDRVDTDLIELFTRPTLDRGAARTLYYLVKSRTQADFSDSTEHLLSQITSPILLLWGRQDSILPLAWADSIMTAKPTIDYQVIENAGHCLYDEVPDAVHRAVSDWLLSTASAGVA